MTILKELINLNEAKGNSIKVALVYEGHWDKDYDDGGGERMTSAFEIPEADLNEISEQYGMDFYELIDDDDMREELISSLEDGSIGNKLPDVKIFSHDEDMGSEGVEGPEGYELVFSW